MLGFVIGIARLSNNWLVARLAAIYVELIRNLPLLLQLLFWYNAVLKALPELRDSLMLPGGGFLNNRGLFLPEPVFKDGFGAVLAALVVGDRRRDRVPLLGEAPADAHRPAGAGVSRGARAGHRVAACCALILTGFPVDFLYPEKGRFNIRGGMEMLPEFMALLFGLVIYTAAFIAEVVRAGILAVAKGQTEAAYSLGLRPGRRCGWW